MTGYARLSKHGSSWPTGSRSSPASRSRRRPNDWPSEGTLVLDHLLFRVKAFNASGQAIPGGRVVVDVFAAMG